MGKLFNQVAYDNEAGFIDNFKDYNRGDVIYVEDSIEKLTTLYFYDNITKVNVNWAFSENLTDKYCCW